ncbi:PQQ-dependent sugar dehydrogenase, partial [Nocardioides sp. GCM10030258]
MTHLVSRRAAASLLVIGLLVTGCGQGGNTTDIDVSGTATAAPTGTVRGGEITFAVDGIPDVVATIATGLATPWGVDFLPDGRAVVTERDSARVLVVTSPKIGKEPTKEQGKVVEVGRIPEVDPRGEAGLLGVAVSPAFATD